MPVNGIVRIVHTSDLHLGASGAEPGSPQDHAGNALKALVQKVRTMRADLVVVAGDVFDHNRVSDELLDFTCAQFTALDLPVVLLPGNHDCLQPESAFWRLDTTKAPNCYVVKDSRGETISFPELGVGLWGQPLMDYGGPQRPLSNLPPRGPEHWQLAVAHGHYTGDVLEKYRSWLITNDDIRETKRDYVALGHWDVFQSVSRQPLAFYSGAPDKMGAVALVELDPARGISLQQVPIGFALE